jgi:hypothetical protein
MNTHEIITVFMVTLLIVLVSLAIYFGENKPTINCEEAIRVAYQLGQEDLVLEVLE